MTNSNFNTNSRTKNVIWSSFVGFFGGFSNTILGFIYRTVFIYILSNSYLGLNGLFSNILSLLSFTELGITSCITYRFYKPISENDTEQVGKLMNFLKFIYLFITAIILTLGLGLFPFIHYFIKDTAEIPADVNIYTIYILFLIQTVSSYLYSYKITLLIADQKQYLYSIAQSLMTLIKYIVQFIVLFSTKNFTANLIAGIFVTLSINYLTSVWVKHSYKDVFKVKGIITKDEQKRIWNDTKATMCHKVGSTVLTSTDSIVLSSFVGLTAVGIYSNYYLLINSLENLLKPILSNLTASLGNAHVELSNDENFEIYKKLQFITLMIAGVTTVCLGFLVNAFINIWLGENMVFDDFTVVMLCLQFYINVSRKMNQAFIAGTGLFVKDKIRPFIEAGINLVVSIALAYKIGIAGVFIGTVISHILTICWREPYILFKYEFQKPLREYWKQFLSISFFNAFIFGTLFFNRDFLIFINLETKIAQAASWAAYGVLAVFIYMIMFTVVFYRTKEFKFFIGFLMDFYEKIKKKAHG